MKYNRHVLIFGSFFMMAIVSFGFAGRTSAGSSDIAFPTPTPKPVASPTPAATPIPRPLQTLEDLQAKIRQRLFSTEVRRGRVGVKIVSLNSGKVVFENDSEKYYMPASNMKNFTVATALERLGPDFKFVTSITSTNVPDADGIIKGDLRITGRGDISQSTSFDPAFPGVSNYYRPIDLIVDKIAAAGVKKIEGNVIGDESYFRGFAIPEGWEWDDLHTYYGTEISALPLNDNVVDISVAPTSSGQSCLVSVSPGTQLVRFINKCTTGGSDTVRIVKLINQNVFEVTGSIPTGAKTKTVSFAFTHVADLFVDLLKQRLAARGIIVTGAAKVTNTPAEAPCPNCPAPPAINLGSIESPPLSIIAAKTMKPSQNMYTETLLWTLGEQIGRKNGGSGNSDQLGLSVVKGFMKQIGVADDGIVQYDGSGLSRHDLITPSAVVTLYTYMAKQSKYAQAWRDSLTIGGVDGTLRNRFKGTAAEGNMRGKTGTIDQVSALSGYLTTAGGEQLVVSFVVNGVPIPAQRTALIDEIVVQLANFNGKID
ncbi:MAG: D-alanyl-D-alanine carboxypeptidase/D-alanyl-D-alanine-endopeptidase [Chloracidobacterium sp.]|nr:D-alanyl-D-alanine carboxypeptidase/D-alanyl-D-alanine-endopeptidase [Chloracidobacterium sp.]